MGPLVTSEHLFGLLFCLQQGEVLNFTLRHVCTPCRLNYHLTTAHYVPGFYLYVLCKSHMTTVGPGTIVPHFTQRGEDHTSRIS